MNTSVLVLTEALRSCREAASMIAGTRSCSAATVERYGEGRGGGAMSYAGRGGAERGERSGGTWRTSLGLASVRPACTREAEDTTVARSREVKALMTSRRTFSSRSCKACNGSSTLSKCTARRCA